MGLGVPPAPTTAQLFGWMPQPSSTLQNSITEISMSHIPHLINGERIEGQGRPADVFTPATGEVIHQVALADRATIQQAIDAAKAAFPAWRNTPPAKRAQVMFRFKQF